MHFISHNIRTLILTYDKKEAHKKVEQNRLTVEKDIEIRDVLHIIISWERV